MKPIGSDRPQTAVAHRAAWRQHVNVHKDSPDTGRNGKGQSFPGAAGPDNSPSIQMFS